MPTHPSGPGAPWLENADAIEYIGDAVLYAEALEEVANLLAGNLEARAELLRESPTMDSITTEVRRQMATAASHGDFGSVRELNDVLLSLYYARENTKRAV